jgi:hypothetical protein
MGDIFSFGGGLSLMVSNLITRAWFILTFSLISSTKCWIASGDRADWCGPRLIALSMFARIHVLPVLVGHLNCVQFIKMAAAGCSTARPAGHIELQNVGLDLAAACLCVIHKGVAPSACCKAHLLLWFSACICFLFAPIIGLPVAWRRGGVSPMLSLSTRPVLIVLLMVLEKALPGI